MAIHSQVSFAGGEIGPEYYRRGDLAKYRVGLAEALNCIARPHGALERRAGTQFIADIGTADARIVPFVFDDDEAYVLIFTDLAMKVHQVGQSGLVQSGGGDFSLTTTYAAASLSTLRFTVRDDTVYITHPLYPIRKLTRVSASSWTIADVTFSPSITAPSSPSASFTADSDQTSATDTASADSSYKVTSVAEDSGEESLPSADFTDSSITDAEEVGLYELSWSAVSGASYYYVYKEENGVYGYIGRTTETSFEDNGFDPDTSDTPPGDRQPFDGAGSYPSVSTFFQNRLVFANTVNEPLGLEFSQSAAFENFNESDPAKATDAISIRATQRGTRRGAVYALVPFRSLLAFTNELIVEVKATEGSVLAPGQVLVDPQLYAPSDIVQPIAIDQEVLMIEQGREQIHSIKYQFAADSYEIIWRSVFCYHLFEDNPIAQWSFARSPDYLVTMVLDDGAAAAMTFRPEHDSYGACPWQTDGAFLDVCVASNGVRDIPFFIVRRTIDGSTAHYLEQLADRREGAVEDMVFVDCAITYAGAATTAPSGFDALEGREVIGLGDGAVIRNLKIDGGVVKRLQPDGSTAALSSAVEKLTVGLPFTSRGRNLPIPQNSEVWKNVSSAFLTFRRASTVRVGSSLTNLTPKPPPLPSTFNSVAQLRDDTVRVDIASEWQRDGQIYFETDDPLPMTLLSLVLEFKHGGR